jgi:hypothetical protein
VVLEIAEDAFSDTGDEEYAKAYGPVAPFPYLVYAEGIGLTSQTIFVDGFPDLVRLLNELLPLIGRPTPRMATLYRLHKWWASWGHFPLEIAE